MSAPPRTDVDVVIVGAGFAGLYMLHRVRDVLGLRALAIEAAGGVGGTWCLNRYPGARCDSESYVYCYSFSQELLQEWDWSGKYPQQPEILAYLEHVAERFDLYRDIRLGTRVTAARYQDGDGTWRVETDAGDVVTCRFLVTGVGLLASAPYRPDIPGLDTFAGECHHTGRWPHEPVDLRGRRVGVIGTGSTGVQAIPVIAEQAQHLHVFQRTPQFAVPARHHTVDRAVLARVKANYDEIWAKARWSVSGFPWQHNGRSALEATPEERQRTFQELWDQGGFRFVFGSYRDLLTDIRANDLAAEFVRGKIRQVVSNPETAAKLLPFDHPFAGRRPIIDTDYFETYNRDDVTLVDVRKSPIAEVTPRGVRTADEEIELDTIVLATGFDAVTGPFTRIDVRGRNGAELRREWAAGPGSYLGLAVAGFPNMFMITGPGATFGNLPVSIEHHVEWIASCIADCRRNDLGVIEARPEAQREWGEHVRAQASRVVTARSGSWYDGANIPGKPRSPLFFFGSFGLYRRRCEDVAANGYEGFDRRRAPA